MKKILLLPILCLFTVSANAQFLSLLNEDLYKSRVKLVSEFFDRFNGNRLSPTIRNDTTDIQKKNLLLLFDLSMFKSKQDSLFLRAEDFSERILRDNVKLNYQDTTWCAKAKCQGKLSGKQIDFTLYLNVEKREADMFKWVIAKAEGGIFELSEKQHVPYMLMPDEHEINYMSLYRMTKETYEYVLDFKSKNLVIDQTSVFLSLVKMGLLKINYVEDLTFMFFQVPGYVFCVKQIERDNFNAGWLISSFKDISIDEKEAFISWLHN